MAIQSQTQSLTKRKTALGYLNISIVDSAGKNRRIGTINFDEASEVHAMLHDKLIIDVNGAPEVSEAVLEKLVDKLVFSYNPASTAPIDLGI